MLRLIENMGEVRGRGNDSTKKIKHRNLVKNLLDMHVDGNIPQTPEKNAHPNKFGNYKTTKPKKK